MLLSKKIDVYKKKDRVILYVASGPGGWISAIWSFCINSEKFELDVSLHSHGLTSLGIISLRATHVSPQFLTSDAEVGLLVHAPRSVLWHPSGERIVVVEAGRVFIFGVSWVSKVRRNLQEIQTTTISMKRANEIYCDQLEEEDQTEREEGNAVAASEMIGVKITVRNSSTHIGASAAALACTIFQDISGSSVGAANSVFPPVSQARSTQLPSATATGHHTGRILIGTESGAVLSLCWGLPGDNEESNYSIADTLDQSMHSVRTTSTLSYTQHGYENDSFYDEDEGHKKAHSYTTAGRLLATVICPAQQDFTQNESESPFGATSPRNHGSDDSEEHRDLMRIWQANAYPLRTSIDNNNIPVNGALNNNNTFPEVVDIGDISNFGTESPRANAMVDVDLSTDHSYTYTRTSESEVKGSSSHSTRSVSYWSAAAVKEIVCCDRNKTLLVVYGDGSFSVCMLVPVVVQVPKLASLHTTPTVVSANAKSTTIGAPTQPSTTSVHTFVVHSSAKIHPVVLVAYPAQPVVIASVDPTVVDATMKKGYQSGQDNVGKAVADVVPTQPEHAHQPDIYQLGSSGAYRSTQYTTARDVQCTLDLTPSLYKKVTRMRKLVTGRAEEEISRVLSVKVVYDNTAVTAPTGKGTSNGTTSSAATTNGMNSCMRVVALVQSRHLPTLHCKGTSGEVLLGARQESLSIVVYDVSLHSNSNTSNSVHTEGREIQCSCISSVCVDKNVTSVPSTTPIYEPSLQLISLPQNHNTHILIHHADNRVTCRSLDNLHSVVFVVNPLPHSIRPSLTTVSVCMNRILITSWDNSTPAGKQHTSKFGAQPPDTTKSLHHTSSHSTQTDSTTAHHAYVTGKHALPSVPHVNTGDSRIVILPILTSVTCKGLQSQNKLMYVDLGEGALHTIDTHASQHTPMPTASENRERSDTQDCITTHNNTTAKATSIASIINSNADTLDNNNIYSAPLVTTQLKLPRKLISDVQHYRSLCSINNPFQTRKLFRNVQEGLLIASSQQCREENFYPVLYNKHGVCNHIDNSKVTHHGASGAKTEYLAMIAGGSRVPFKHTSSAPSATTISTTHTRNHTTSSYITANAPLRKFTPLLWVYNTSTCRWRSTYLIAGNAESSACLVKDIPSVHSLRKDANIHLYTTTKDNIKAVKLSNKISSSASVDSDSTNATNLALRSGSIDSHHSAEVTASSTKSTKRRNSDNSVTLSSQNHTLTRTGSDPPETPTINNASKGFNVRSLFSFTNNANKSCADETDAAHVYKPSTNVPINNRSHMAGSASSILSIAWYNVHSIVLLTLRRSTYCIEIISREASKHSMSTGKLQPLVHKIIMLPPGYSPNSLECIVVPSEHSVGNGQANNISGYNVHTPLASDKGVLSPTLHTHTIDEGNESGTDSSSEDSDIVDTELPADISSNNNNNSVFALQPPTPLSVHNSTKSTAYKPVSTKSVNTNAAAAAAGLSGCVVVVSDHSTLLCYHVQAQGTYVTSVAGSSKHSSKANTSNNTLVAANAQTLQVNDYLVTELWDLNLPSLTVSDVRPSTIGTSHSTDTLPVPVIQFPVKNVKVFVQNTPLNDAQVEGYHRMSLCYHHPNQSVVPVFPVVSLHILDYTGNVFSVDAENGVCTYLSGNVSSISAVSNRDICVNSMVRTTRDASDGNSSSATLPSSLHTAVIASPLLLHNTQDPAGDAQRDLLYIFEKTSLIQHIRPEALSIQRNLLHYSPQLLVPVNILVKHHSDKSDVHSFSDTDLQRRHKRMYTMQTGHISAQLSYANSDNTVIHTHQGLFVTLGTKVANISDYMRSRKSGFKATDKHNTTANGDGLEFVPYLCTAFSHCLHSDADVHGQPMAQLNLYNTTDTPATATNVHLQHTVLQTLSAQLLHKMRSSIRYSALLIAYMEYSVMQYTLQASFSYKHPQYAALTQFMYDHDPCLLGEVLSRLGRKLEPVVSHQLFPVQVQASPSQNEDVLIAPQTTSVVRLYESFLQCRHNHHAARVLSLACECIGGSESHITTAASLILALELLHYSMKYTSLRNVVECVDFCSRLECMLVMHSRNIFGVHGGATNNGSGGNGVSQASVVTTPHSPRSLDNSYTSTVKSKALSLIQHHRDLVYRQTRYAIQQTAETMKVPDINDTVFTPTAAASPALPFYLGMGVNWILTKAVNSLIPETVQRNNHSQVPVPLQLGNGTAGNNTANSSVRGITGLSLNVNTSIVHTTCAVYSKDDYLRQCMMPSVASIRTVSPTDTSVYHYKVIDMLEQHYGPVAVSQMLSRTHLTPAVHTSVRSVSNDSANNRVHSSGDSHGATSNTTGVVPSIVMTAIASTGVSNAHIGDQSPTALLLVHTLRNYFSASTHYVNAAVLLVALLQHTTTVQLLHHYLMSMHGSNNTNNAEDVGATSKEKVRRILYVYRLNKVLSRTSITHSNSMNISQHSNEGISKILTQRVSAQYLRRVVEADVIHYHTSHHSHNNNNNVNMVNRANMISETPRQAVTPGSVAAVTSGTGSEAASPHLSHAPPAATVHSPHKTDRRAYFELTEELLLQNKEGTIKTGTKDSNGRYLNLLTILKSLAVGLLLVGDSVGAGLLLQTIMPYLKHIDSGLYSVLSALPPVQNVAHTTAGASNEEGERQLWELSAEQLDKLFLSLV